METGDVESARDLYDAALALDPNFAYAMFRRGQIAESEGDEGGALALYLRVFAQGPRAGVLGYWARLRIEALEAAR
jgi:predicted TPR repeat methyltransferase